MAFTWLPASGGSVIHAAFVNQMKANNDSIANQRGLGHFGWTHLPAAPTANIEFHHIQELRNAADYVQDNSCTAQYISDHVTWDAGYDADADTTVDGTKNVTIHVGQDNAVLGVQNTALYSGRDITVYAGQDNAVLNSQYTGLYSSQDTTNYNSLLSPYCPTQYNTVNNPRNVSV